MSRTAERQVSFADWELMRQGLRLAPLLQAISDFLDDQKGMIEQVRCDLIRGLKNAETGRSGLVSHDDEGWQITDAGLSLLRSLETSALAHNTCLAPESQALRLIDGVIGTEERLRIFDLKLKSSDGDAGMDSDHQSRQEEEKWAAIETADAVSEVKASGQIPEDRVNQLSSDEKDRMVAIEPPDAALQDAPAFLRRGFASRIQDSDRKVLPLAPVFAFVAQKKEFLVRL